MVSLEVAKIGGIRGGMIERNLMNQLVLIKTKNGEKVPGIVVTKLTFKPEEAQKIPRLEQMFIDVGLKKSEEVRELGIDKRVSSNLLSKVHKDREGYSNL